MPGRALAHAALAADLDDLVAYMTFAGEAPLPEPVEGVSSFTATFPGRGPTRPDGPLAPRLRPAHAPVPLSDQLPDPQPRVRRAARRRARPRSTAGCTAGCWPRPPRAPRGRRRPIDVRRLRSSARPSGRCRPSGPCPTDRSASRHRRVDVDHGSGPPLASPGYYRGVHAESCIFPICRVALLAAALVAAAGADAAAQLRRIPVELVSASSRASGVRAGSTVRAALQVTLPEGLHVQSNKPRDPSLIPTELTLRSAHRHPRRRGGVPHGRRLPAGRTRPAAARLRPPLHDRRAAGDGADLAPGPHAVPFVLRYQACDDKVCFAPSSAKGEWTLDVVAAGAAGHRAARRRARRDCLRHAARRPAWRRRPSPRAAPRRRQRPATPAWPSLETFTVVATTGGYLGTGRLHDVHPNAEAGRDRARALRGPRPAGHPAARAPRRTGAQPHAVRAADDSDQPRHHRRRRAGRIAPARVPARA